MEIFQNVLAKTSMKANNLDKIFIVQTAAVESSPVESSLVESSPVESEKITPPRTKGAQS